MKQYLGEWVNKGNSGDKVTRKITIVDYDSKADVCLGPNGVKIHPSDLLRNYEKLINPFAEIAGLDLGAEFKSDVQRKKVDEAETIIHEKVQFGSTSSDDSDIRSTQKIELTKAADSPEAKLLQTLLSVQSQDSKKMQICTSIQFDLPLSKDLLFAVSSNTNIDLTKFAEELCAESKQSILDAVYEHVKQTLTSSK